jgi:hypothetical protein
MKKFKLLALVVAIFAIVSSFTSSKMRDPSMGYFKHPITNGCEVGYNFDPYCSWGNFGTICVDVSWNQPLFLDEYSCIFNETEFYLRHP